MCIRDRFRIIISFLLLFMALDFYGDGLRRWFLFTRTQSVRLIQIFLIWCRLSGVSGIYKCVWTLTPVVRYGWFNGWLASICNQILLYDILIAESSHIIISYFGGHASFGIHLIQILSWSERLLMWLRSLTCLSTMIMQLKSRIITCPSFIQRILGLITQ